MELTPAVALPTPNDEIARAMLETLQTRRFSGGGERLRPTIMNRKMRDVFGKRRATLAQRFTRRICSGRAEQYLDRASLRNRDWGQALADEELYFVLRECLGLDDHVMQCP